MKIFKLRPIILCLVFCLFASSHTVIAGPDSEAPTIYISEPFNEKHFLKGESIPICASASGKVVPVQAMELYIDEWEKPETVVKANLLKYEWLPDDNIASGDHIIRITGYDGVRNGEATVHIFIVDPKGKPGEGNVVEDFQNLSQWKVEKGSLNPDYTNFKKGMQGAKVVSVKGDKGIITKKGFGSFLKNRKQIGLWVYIPEATDIANLEIALSSDPGFSKFYYKYIALNNPKWKIQNGWNYILINKQEFTNKNSDEWDNLSSIRLYVYSQPGSTATCTFGEIVVDPVLIPKLVFTFDDFDVSIYSKAFPILKAAGMKGTFYVASGQIDKPARGKVTVDQLKEMYANGWDIGNHTVTHADLNAIFEEDALAEIKGCSEWLRSNGFTRSAYHMSYTGGFNQHLADLAEIAGMTTARTHNVSSFGEANLPNNLLQFTCALEMQSTTTEKDVCDMVDSIIESGGTGFITVYKIEDSPAGKNSCSTEVFKALVDYCVKRKIDVVTVSELIGK